MNCRSCGNKKHTKASNGPYVQRNFSAPKFRTSSTTKASTYHYEIDRRTGTRIKVYDE